MLLVATGGAILYTALNKPKPAAAAPKPPESTLHYIGVRTLFVSGDTFAASAINLYEGVALTARHVCEGEKPSKVWLINIENKRFKPYKFIKDKNPMSDLCIILYKASKKGPMGLTPTVVAGQGTNVIGEQVFSGGYPMHELGPGVFRFTWGVATRTEVVLLAGGQVVAVDIVNFETLPGASGSGVFNERRELVGIISVGGGGMVGMVPLNLIRELLTKNGILL